MQTLNHILARAPQRVFTEEQYIADCVYQYFGKKLAFPRIMKMIKEHGKIFIRETLEEIKKTECDDKLALFLWKVKSNQVIWEKTYAHLGY